MNIATSTAPTTDLADRFRCESEVPDPPRDAAGRKQYWEDTVAEAVAELRRRLASGRDERSFQALEMILDLEKTRIRHKTPVAGTQVSGGYSSPLPPMETEPPIRAGSASDGSSQAPSLTLPARTEAEDLTVAEEPVLPTSPRREEVGDDAAGRGATSQADPMPADPRPAVPLNTPSPERGGGRGVGSSAPLSTDNWKEVGPDGLTADQRAWIREGHDYYDRLDAARDVRLIW